jgi:hypothetical protein
MSRSGERQPPPVAFFAHFQALARDGGDCRWWRSMSKMPASRPRSRPQRPCPRLLAIAGIRGWHHLGEYHTSQRQEIAHDKQTKTSVTALLFSVLSFVCCFFFIATPAGVSRHPPLIRTANATQVAKIHPQRTPCPQYSHRAQISGESSELSRLSPIMK